MKVLVTGAHGQLGHDVVDILEKNEISCLGIDKDDVDITDEKQIKKTIIDYNPEVVIHCAAYTAVDKAEDEQELCYGVNVLGTRYIAKACKLVDAKMVYISTDYVFDGEGEKPFEVTDKPNPVNYYGLTKYEGELEVQKILEKYFIVRISWLFGSHGNNFVKTMLRLAKEKDEISVVADQIGSPTYTYDVAELLLEMIKTDKYGIYHATNEGYCSWYDFAVEIFRQADMDVKVRPISSNEYLTRAKRPRNSRLGQGNTEKIHFPKTPSWKRSLKKHLNYTNYGVNM